MKLGHNFRNPKAAMVVAPLADLLRRMLEPKLAAVQTFASSPQSEDSELKRVLALEANA